MVFATWHTILYMEHNDFHYCDAACIVYELYILTDSRYDYPKIIDILLYIMAMERNVYVSNSSN